MKYRIAITDYSGRYVGVGLEGLYLTDKYPHLFDNKNMAEQALATAQQIYPFKTFVIQEHVE